MIQVSLVLADTEKDLGQKRNRVPNFQSLPNMFCTACQGEPAHQIALGGVPAGFESGLMPLEDESYLAHPITSIGLKALYKQTPWKVQIIIFNFGHWAI